MKISKTFHRPMQSLHTNINTENGNLSGHLCLYKLCEVYVIKPYAPNSLPVRKVSKISLVRANFNTVKKETNSDQNMRNPAFRNLLHLEGFYFNKFSNFKQLAKP